MFVEFTRDKMFSCSQLRVHHFSQWFTTLYACYSRRWLLNLRFLHSMHVIELYICWISFSEKMFFTCTAILCFSIFLHCFYCVNHNFSHISFSWQELSSPIISSENKKYYHSCSVSTVAASAWCSFQEGSCWCWKSLYFAKTALHHGH